MSLYRAQLPRARDRSGARALARARCAALAAPLALVPLALAFFAPFLRDDSPLSMVLDSRGAERVQVALFLWTPHLGAAVLAALLVVIAVRERARRRRRGALPRPADHRLFRVAAAATAATSVSGLGLLSVLISGDPPSTVAFVFTTAALASLAAGGALGFRARRATGWRRWGRLLAAFTALVTPILVLHVYFVVERRRAGPSGWIATAAAVALWILAAVAAWPARRAAASPPRAGSDAAFGALK